MAKPSVLDLHLVHSPTEPAPPARRRTGALLAVVALLVGLLGGVLLTRQPAAPRATAPTSKAPTTTVPLTPQTPPDKTPPVVPPAADDSVVPTTTPPGVTWQNFEGIALPSSSTAGPTRTTGPVVAGFAHTPVGALIASLQITARMIATRNGGWQQVVAEQVMPSPGRDRFLHLASGLPDSPPPGGGYAQPAGFRYVVYRPTLAVLQVVFRQSNGVLSDNTVTMAWDRGDWRLVLQTDGLPGPPAVLVPTLVGFVPFGDF